MGLQKGAGTDTGDCYLIRCATGWRCLLSLLIKATDVTATTVPRCCLPDDDENPIYTLPNNKKRRRLPPRTTAVQPVRENYWQQPRAGLMPLQRASVVQPPFFAAVAMHRTAKSADERISSDMARLVLWRNSALVAAGRSTWTVTRRIPGTRSSPSSRPPQRRRSRRRQSQRHSSQSAAGRRCSSTRACGTCWRPTSG